MPSFSGDIESSPVCDREEKNDEVRGENREDVQLHKERDDFLKLSLHFKGNYKKMSLMSYLCQKICVCLSFLITKNPKVKQNLQILFESRSM